MWIIKVQRKSDSVQSWQVIISHYMRTLATVYSMASFKSSDVDGTTFDRETLYINICVSVQVCLNMYKPVNQYDCHQKKFYYTLMVKKKRKKDTR